MYDTCLRAGVVEIWFDKDETVRVECNFFEVSVFELAVCYERNMFRVWLSALDVYCEAFPVQHGLSDDVAELCVRYDSGNGILPRECECGQMGRSVLHRHGMCTDSKIVMRRLLTIVLVMLSCACSAQTDNRQIVDKINEATSALASMECEFVQTKSVRMLNEKMVSKGKLYYQRGNKLRWEYVTPYTYTFIINGAKVYLRSNGRSDVIDVNRNKMFKEIATIMMNSIVGKSINDEKLFRNAIQDEAQEWVVTLTPQAKEMKQMFSRILLHFSKQLLVVDKVEMYEKKGDVTIISLTNIKKNQKTDASLFTLD